MIICCQFFQKMNDKDISNVMEAVKKVKIIIVKLINKLGISFIFQIEIVSLNVKTTLQTIMIFIVI